MGSPEQTGRSTRNDLYKAVAFRLIGAPLVVAGVVLFYMSTDRFFELLAILPGIDLPGTLSIPGSALYGGIKGLIASLPLLG
jgi:hypothetical protein